MTPFFTWILSGQLNSIKSFLSLQPPASAVEEDKGVARKSYFERTKSLDTSASSISISIWTPPLVLRYFGQVRRRNEHNKAKQQKLKQDLLQRQQRSFDL
jgi:hypothetical protein